MTITTNWKIEGVDCLTQVGEYADVVYTIHWRVFATDGTDTTSVYSSCIISFVEGGNFTPYQNLTEEQVLEWTFASLGEEGKTKAEQAAVSALEDIISPKIISNPLPWA